MELAGALDLGASDGWERGTGGGWVFWRERERERERERDFKRESDCGSDKYRGVRKRANVKCFTKILSVKYFT